MAKAKESMEKKKKLKETRKRDSDFGILFIIKKYFFKM